MSLLRLLVGVVLALVVSTSLALAKEIQTNEVSMSGTPSWLKEGRVNRVVERIQRFMEWDIRKVQVVWHQDQTEFENVHHFGASVLAVTFKPENVIHMGPRVTTSNFDIVFGHELVHVILFQKYKKSVPIWLEEGLANYAAKKSDVDYRWLASQPDVDVTRLGHPFVDSANKASVTSQYHYQASTALIQMIASKCNLEDLLQLSLGTNLENYLATTCEIRDVNATFRGWLKKKTRR